MLAAVLRTLRVCPAPRLALLCIPGSPDSGLLHPPLDGQERAAMDGLPNRAMRRGMWRARYTTAASLPTACHAPAQCQAAFFSVFLPHPSQRQSPSIGLLRAGLARWRLGLTFPRLLCFQRAHTGTAGRFARNAVAGREGHITSRLLLLDTNRPPGVQTGGREGGGRYLRMKNACCRAMPATQQPLTGVWGIPLILPRQLSCGITL